jgi:hypothetical protein
MRRYTVYEIEKLTDGKLSKYKLNQAILKGDLKAERVHGNKRGRGTPKYYVYEEDLQSYLRMISEERKHKISIVAQAEVGSVDDKVKEVVERLLSDKEEMLISHTNEISDLKSRLKMLEKSQGIEPKTVISATELAGDNSSKSETRKTLLTELANTSVFAIHKRREILRELNKLA